MVDAALHGGSAAAVACLLLLAPLGPHAHAQQRAEDPGALLYRNLDYGSDAYFSPLTVLLNKGYDIFQLRNHGRDFWAFEYGRGWENGIADVFRNPGPAVERFGGWNRFLRVEVLPISPSLREMNWFVNYTEHFLIGGLTMRALDQWYESRGFPLPRLWAAATTYAASMINEVVEHPASDGAAASTVADLLIFDVAAVLFFHWDQPTRFLAETLQAADWSNLASLTFPNGQLQNNGQYYSFKVPVGLERTRLFLRGGMGAQLGVTRSLGAEHHLSVAVGADSEVRDIDPETGHETVDFALGAGVYFDRNNSLLWSVTMSPAENLAALNVYPGVLPGPARDLGLWAVYTRHGDVMMGLVHRRALSVGGGLGW